MVSDQFSFDGYSTREISDNSKISYEHIHVRNSTFLGGLASPAHQWFRLTPSFGPDLVDIMLNDMNTDTGHVVFDPFAGASTTLIQCKKNRITSYGTEINPFLYFVGKTSLNWNLSSEKLLRALTVVENEYKQAKKMHRGVDVENIGLKIPPIHNVYRWWRKDVLKDLLILKKCIFSIANTEVQDFLKLALAAVLIPDLTNVTLGRLQLHFVDKNNVEMNVWDAFHTHAVKMIQDIATIAKGDLWSPSEVINTDATKIQDTSFSKKIKFDRVITSPPYPNRYSYVWNTRPYLYFFDMMDTGKEAAELDKNTIGGTWGSATSILQKGVIEPQFPILAEKVSPLTDEIRKTDNLMANYVMKYFNLLAVQIKVQNELLSADAKCAYVVGCSEIKNVYIETDALLADIFEGLDPSYHVDDIKRFRKRNSGVDLHESIVYVSKR